MAVPRGCFLSDEGRLCIPRALVEGIIANACHRFTIDARDPAFDVTLGGSYVNSRPPARR